MVLFHGTDAQFDSFDPEAEICLTPHRPLARCYGRHVLACVVAESARLKSITLGDWFRLDDTALEAMKTEGFDGVVVQPITADLKHDREGDEGIESCWWPMTMVWSVDLVSIALVTTYCEALSFCDLVHPAAQPAV